MMITKQTMGRRDFLRIIGVSGLAGVGLKLGFDQINSPDASAQVVEETRLLMGTVVNLKLVTDDPTAGQAALNACFDQMAGLEAVMSRHQPASQLSQLNRDGVLNNPDAHLVHVLQEAVRLSELTDGAFDVTVKPLVDLYASYHQDGVLPAAEAVQEALQLVDYTNIHISDDQISFADSGMAVTLDGIAKGYIVDQGTAVLRGHGFDNVFVEAGGDLAAVGEKLPETPWRVGVLNPRSEQTQLLNAFSVSNQAVATSGDYMQPYTDDYVIHHIIDPRTGYSAPEMSSVTVAAETGMEADALATALMVLGSEAGLNVVQGMSGCEAYMVTKDLDVHQSSGFGSL